MTSTICIDRKKKLKKNEKTHRRIRNIKKESRKY
jgi:hypothetical protein